MQPTRNIAQVSRYALITLVLATMGLSLPSAAARPVNETVIPEVSLSATRGNGQQKLAEDPDGSIYIIYTTPLGGEDAIVVSRSDDVGASWVSDAVLSRPGIRAGLGSLAIDAEGTLHATWVDYETVGHVWYASGKDDAWTESVKISPGPTYSGYPVVVAARHAVHVLWYSAPPDETTRQGSHYEIRHTSQNSQGWTEPVLVSTGSPDSVNPTAVADQDGNVRSAWYQLEGQTYRVNYSVWDTKRWTQPDGLSPTAQNATQVSIDIAPDGTTYLVWGQYQAGVPGIALAVLAEGVWSDPEFLTNGPAEDPVLTTNSEGDVVVAWSARGEIIVLRSEDGEWASPEKIGSGASPTFAASDRLMIAWTRPARTGFELVIANLSEAGTTPLSAAVVGAVALAMILAALTTRRRSRSRRTQRKARPVGSRVRPLE